MARRRAPGVTRVLRHLRDRLADAGFVLLSTLPWLPAALQRAADRRRDEQAAAIGRRVQAIEERERQNARPLVPGERIRRIRARQAEDATAQHATVEGRRRG